MPFCGTCGAEVDSNANFCNKCGSSIRESSGLRKEEYAGKVYKCPQCGGPLESFSGSCPHCGAELRSVAAVSSARDLAMQLDKIEAQRSKGLVDKLVNAASNSNSISATDERKVSLIRNYPIPNAREDLLEFFALAASNFTCEHLNSARDPTASERAIAEAWEAKLDQAYNKACLLLTGDEALVQLQRIYEEKKIEARHARQGLLRAIVIGGCLFAAAILFITVLLEVTVRL